MVVRGGRGIAVLTRTLVGCYLGGEMKKAERSMYQNTSGIELECILTLRLLMSYIYIYIYIYGALILDVSRSHTTTQHIR